MSCDDGDRNGAKQARCLSDLIDGPDEVWPKQFRRLDLHRYALLEVYR